MIDIVRKRFSDDVEYFTDTELAYFLGYERIPFDELTESDTLWKLRSWGKYENYRDAAEDIFEDSDVFTEEFYKQDLVDQFDQAEAMLKEKGFPMMITEDREVWVKRTDWN